MPENEKRNQNKIKAIVIAVAVIAVIIGVVSWIASTVTKPETTASESSTAEITEVETKPNPEAVRKTYESFLESEEAKIYCEISSAFKGYYNEGDEYDNYVNNLIGTDTLVNYFDLDGDGADECVLRVCFYNKEALDHYVYYIFDIDGENVVCVDSADAICGDHRSLYKMQIFKRDGEYFIRKYLHDPHERMGSVYKYDGKKLVFVESIFATDIFEEDDQSYVNMTCFYTDKYDFYNENAENYLAIDWDNSGFASSNGLKVLTYDELAEIIAGYDNNEVYHIVGQERALQETFISSKFYSSESETHYVCRDFNNDGELEMFVLRYEEEIENYAYITPCSLYFITGQNVSLVEKDLKGTPGFSATAYSVGGRWFFTYAQRFSGGDDEYFYTAIGNRPVNVTVGGGSAEVTGENEISLSFVDYNQYVDGGGRTNLYYSFYWDESELSFKEYGAISITKQDFSKLDGADIILEKINAAGYSIKDILYRENGIININCDNGTINVNYSCIIADGNKVTFAEDYDEIGNSFGIYAKAANPDIAVYPDKFTA